MITKKPIIGQECICPDGLGRVAAVHDDVTKMNYNIEVHTYIGNRSCHWAASNVQLIDPVLYSPVGIVVNASDSEPLPDADNVLVPVAALKNILDWPDDDDMKADYIVTERLIAERLIAERKELRDLIAGLV